MSRYIPQINVKLGGTNHVVKSLPKVGLECMMIGVDVTHPMPGGEMPSIIASVATTDGQRNRYNSELGAQYNEDRRKKSQETIIEAETIFARHFQAWQESNKGLLPKSVIVFRDGVSEGEYQHVVTNEFDKLKKAAAKVRESKG